MAMCTAPQHLPLGLAPTSAHSVGPECVNEETEPNLGRKLPAQRHRLIKGHWESNAEVSFIGAGSELLLVDKALKGVLFSQCLIYNSVLIISYMVYLIAIH